MSYWRLWFAHYQQRRITRGAKTSFSCCRRCMKLFVQWSIKQLCKASGDNPVFLEHKSLSFVNTVAKCWTFVSSFTSKILESFRQTRWSRLVQKGESQNEFGNRAVYVRATAGCQYFFATIPWFINPLWGRVWNLACCHEYGSSTGANQTPSHPRERLTPIHKRTTTRTHAQTH